MTEFSEAIKSEIKKSQQTLLYLSEASGLSLDHISKMRQGKRLPQDEEKVKKLISALECTETVDHTLRSLYKIEKMGVNEWKCMEEMRKLLEFRIAFLKRYEEEEDVDRSQLHGITVLQTRTEVFTFLQKAVHMRPELGGGGQKHLRIMTEEMPETMVEILASFLHNHHALCEHCFSLHKNRDSDGRLFNICYINKIMPLIQTSDQYIPYYDYEEVGEELIPGWIIGEEWALGLNRDADGGIVLWDIRQIRYLKDMFDRKKRRKRQLLMWFEDIRQWVEHIVQSREGRLKESGSIMLRSGGEKSYYLEPAPCLLFLMPMDMIWKHIVAEDEVKDQLMELVGRRVQQITKENMVHFFTLEGLERLAAEGRLSGIPDAMYTPMKPEERKWILESYLLWMETHDREYYVIDSGQLNLAPQTSVYTAVSLTDNEISLCLSMGDGIYCSIREPGVAMKLSQFCRLMESGEFVYSKEESLRIVRRIIKRFPK